MENYNHKEEDLIKACGFTDEQTRALNVVITDTLFKDKGSFSEGIQSIEEDALESELSTKVMLRFLLMDRILLMSFAGGTNEGDGR